MEYLFAASFTNTLNEQINFLSAIPLRKPHRRDMNIQAIRLAATQTLKMNMIVVVDRRPALQQPAVAAVSARRPVAPVAGA